LARESSGPKISVSLLFASVVNDLRIAALRCSEILHGTTSSGMTLSNH